MLDSGRPANFIVEVLVMLLNHFLNHNSIGRVSMGRLTLNRSLGPLEIKAYARKIAETELKYEKKLSEVEDRDFINAKGGEV